MGFIGAGCSKAKTAQDLDDPRLPKLKDSLASGDYNEALKLSKEIVSEVPPSPAAEEALYLQGYILAYGKSDFQGARLPLKQLLDLFPNHTYAAETRKFLADCNYWEGHYTKAIEEYKKLQDHFGDKGFGSYAQIQIANCLLLNQKVGDALTAYRELIEKYPTDPLADSAQLLIADTYLKLQNPSQARAELQKLMAMTKNRELQHATQKALRQLEEEEPLRKGVGIP